MFIDALGLLSDAQALSGTGGYSTNTIDLGDVTPKRDIGIGEPMALMISVDVTQTGTTPTFEFAFVQSANANLSSEDKLAAVSVPAASLVAGFKFALVIPSGLITKRYIGAKYTLGGTTPTITVTASILPLSMVQAEKVYAKGYVIS